MRLRTCSNLFTIRKHVLQTRLNTLRIVVNSRFDRFLHGFQEIFPHRTRKMLTAYLKFEQQSDFTFFCFAKFCDLYLSIFNDLNIF